MKDYIQGGKFMAKSEKNFQNEFKTSNNPFAQKCENCDPNIWETLMKKAEKLNSKCYPNTYVWIEKFKDDNY